MSLHIVLLCLALSFTSAPVSAAKYSFYSDTKCQTLLMPGSSSSPGPNPIVGPLNSCIKSGKPSDSTAVKFYTCTTSTGATFANYLDYPNCNTVYGNVLTVPASMIDVCQPATDGTSAKIDCSSTSALRSCALALLVAMVAVLL